ncbi:hypothetical protein LX92_00432 [Maribacter polysiphoniae]|uniref:Uncharacterized protein n=1 Tax=Maribacter polysiphoniae TaxID=429344 RepID=A0A316E8K0_9FLAO|nr:hypothetical protein LX92_00432 [Maribacter polysiphoniae]
MNLCGICILKDRGKIYLISEKPWQLQCSYFGFYGPFPELRFVFSPLKMKFNRKTAMTLNGHCGFLGLLCILLAMFEV